MALRQFADGGKPNLAPAGTDPARLPRYAAALGAVGAVVGLVTLLWVPLAEPQFGGLLDRWALHDVCRRCTFTAEND